MYAADDEEDPEAARQREIAAACLDAGGEKTGRLGLYRRLIQSNLAAVARRLLPRTAAHLDQAQENGFLAWFARFLDEASPRTPYLRDVPVELVAWALPIWSQPGVVPAYILDLARYEIDRFQVEAAPRATAPVDLAEVSLTARLVFPSSRKLARYEHAVDQEEASEPLPPLRPGPTWMFLFRDEDNAVHAMPLAHAMAAVLEQLLAGVPLGEAVVRGAASAGIEPTEDMRLEVARLLADLGEKGGLLGALVEPR
jgi:hypothetical protein